MLFSLFIKLILPYLTFAVFAFLITITFTMVFPFVKSNFENTISSFMKEITLPAKIICKKIDNSNYYMTFQLENGRKAEFLVDSYFYNFYSEGEKGMLTYKGTHFLDFERIFWWCFVFSIMYTTHVLYCIILISNIK